MLRRMPTRIEMKPEDAEELNVSMEGVGTPESEMKWASADMSQTPMSNNMTPNLPATPDMEAEAERRRRAAEDARASRIGARR